MAAQFDLVAQLYLRGPANVRQLAANLSRQLSVTANVNVQFNRNANRTISGMTTNVNNLTKAIASLNQQANQATTTIAKLVSTISQFSASQRSTTITVKQAGQSMTQTAQAAKDLSTSVEHFGKQSALAIRRFAAFLIPAKAFLAVTTGIDKGFRAAVNFERELVKVAQVTGKTLGGLKDLSAEITRVSTTFGVASSDLLKASTVLSQAGLTATEVRKSLQLLALTDLAPNFESMTDTVEGFIAIRQQFGTSVDGMTAALSSLNAVAGAYAVESGDIITAIRKTGGAFRAAGGDLNQLVALFTSVRQTTRESADSIATGFRTIFTRMQRLGTSKLLKQVGIDLRDAAGNFVGPFEAVKKLSDALGTIDPRSQLFSQVIEELGGFRQVSKVIPLIQQFGVAQEALNVALRNTNSLEEESGKATATLANRLVSLNEQFLALFRTITGNSVFQTMTGGVLSLASSLIKLADSLEPILPLLTAFAGVKLARAIPGFTAGFFGGIKRAGGGYVPGQGNTDTVPAMLTPGEFVIRKSAAQKLGPRTLNRMNKYATGGEVDVVGDIDAEISSILGGGTLLESEKKKLLKQRGLDAKAAKASELRKIKAGPSTVTIGSTPQFGGFFFQEDNDNPYVGARKGGDLSVSYKTLTSGAQNLLNILGIPQNEGEKLSVVGQPRAMFLPDNLQNRFTDVLNGTIDNITSGVVEKALGIRVDDLNLGLSKSFNKQKFFEGAKSSVDYRDISGKIFESFITGLSAQVGNSQDTFDFRPGRKPRVFDKLFGAGAGTLGYADAKLTANRYAFEDLIGKAVSAAKGPPNQLSGDHLSLFYGGEGPTRSLRAYKARQDEYRVKRAGGGGVPGMGHGDTVPALLTPGEFVIKKSAAQKIGYSTLNNLNNVQKFATGGTVGFQDFVSVVGGGKGPTAGGANIMNQLTVSTARYIQALNPSISTQKALQKAQAMVTLAYQQNAAVVYNINSQGKTVATNLASMNSAITQAKIAMARQQGSPTKLVQPSGGGIGVGVGSIIGLSSAASVFTGGENEVVQSLTQAGITIGTMGLIANDVNGGLVTLAQKVKLLNGQRNVDKFAKSLNLVSTASSVVAGSLLAYSAILNNRAEKLSKDLTDPANFEKFIQERTVANSAQGAGLGTTIGNPVGSAIGAALGGILGFGVPGALVGSAVGGLAGSALGGYFGSGFGNEIGGNPTLEAAIIRQTQGAEKLAETLNAINSGEAFAPTSVGRLRESIANATKFPIGSAADEKAAKALLAKQDVAINSTIKKFLDLNGSLEQFEQGFGKELIALLAQSRSSTYDATRREIEVELEARKKSADAITALNSSILNLKNNMLSLASGQKSFESALENAERGFASLSGGFGGFGNLAISNATDLNKYRSVATGLLGNLGPTGTALGNRAADFATVSRDLPSLLSQLIGVNPDQIALGSEFSDVLKRTYPQISEEVVNEFSGMLARLIEGSENNGLSFQERLRSRPDEVANELLNQGGKEYGEALNSAAETITKFTTMYADKLSDVVKNLDRLTELELRTLSARQEGASIFARAYGAPASAFSNINAAGRNREQAILGNPFGESSRGVGFLRNFIMQSEGTIRSLREQINDPALSKNDRDSLMKQEKLLGKSAADATRALEKLSDSSGRVNDLQNELAQAQSVRESKRGLLDDFIFGAPTDRMKMLTDANLSVGALMQGSLAGVPGSMRPNVGSFLGRLDPNMTLNGMRVDDLIKNLKINEASAMGLPRELAQGIYLPGEQEQEILRSIQEAINLSVEANDALGNVVENSNNFLVAQLESLNRNFLNDLRSIFLQSQARGLESRRLNVESQKGNAEKTLLDTANKIKELFGSGNSLVRGKELATILSNGKVQQALRTLADPKVGGDAYFKALDTTNEAFGPELASKLINQYTMAERNEPGSGQAMFNNAAGIVEALGTFGTNFTALFDRLNKELAEINRQLDEVKAQQQAPLQRAGGGHTRGTDTVPAMLTPGEYVVKASAARRNRSALDHMNFGGVVYAAGGGSMRRKLNGSQQMARDLQGWVNRGGIGKAVAAPFNYVTDSEYFKAVEDGLHSTLNPMFGTGEDLLGQYDAEQRKKAYQAHNNQWRISPYNPKSAYYRKPYDPSKAVAPPQTQNGTNFRLGHAISAGQTMLNKFVDPDYEFNRLMGIPQKANIPTGTSSDALLGGAGSMDDMFGLPDGVPAAVAAKVSPPSRRRAAHPERQAAARNRAFLRGRARAYDRKVRIGNIDPSTMGRNDYIYGPDINDTEGMVNGNIALRRQARRNRLGMPYETVGERNRTGQNALTEGPLPLPNWRAPGQGQGMFNVPDPVRQQEYSRQQGQRDNSTYGMGEECCEIKAQLASAMEQFARIAPPMTDAMNKLSDTMVNNPIPSEIAHTGQQEVHVAVTGLSTQLNAFGEALKPIIVDIVRTEMGKGSVGSAGPWQRMAGKG